MTVIYLLRHGQTEYNTEGRYQGWSDSPLTDLGRRQAQAHGALLAEHLVAPAIWASPLLRAAETARIVADAMPGATLRHDPRLRELSLGIWDGLTRAEIAQGWPGVRKAHPPRQWMFHAPEGEGLAPILARLGDVLAEAAKVQGPIVLVSHGIAGRLLRGLHAGLTLQDSLHLDAPQDAVHRLIPGGGIEVLPHASAL